MKPIVKVCRVFDKETAESLARLGVQFIGLHAIFNMPNAEETKVYNQIIESIDAHYPKTRTVLVTRITDPEELAKVYKTVPTDFVQISGPCSRETKLKFLQLAQATKKHVGIFNVVSGTESLEFNLDDIVGDYVVIDKEFAGGTGELVPKQTVNMLTTALKGKTILLAGGVGRVDTLQHISGLSVDGIDVMSSLEFSKDDKRKDMTKVSALLRNVWGTAASTNDSYGPEG